MTNGERIAIAFFLVLIGAIIIGSVANMPLDAARAHAFMLGVLIVSSAVKVAWSRV